jgi:MtN3 and saliva related transmembrane protein
MTISTTVGLLAALFTAISNLPQVIKCWKTRETEDISLNMLLLLASGLALWIAYGVLNRDWVIAGSNAVSLSLTANLIVLKLIGVFQK